MLLNNLTGETQLDGTEVNVIYTLESMLWIESNLPGISPMEIIDRGRAMRLTTRELQVLLWAGMEASRRRSPAGTKGQVNLSAALKAIKDGGGLYRVLPQVIDAFGRSPGLGLAAAADAEGEAVDPTTEVPSTDDSSESDIIPSMHGA